MLTHYYSIMRHFLFFIFICFTWFAQAQPLRTQPPTATVDMAQYPTVPVQGPPWHLIQIWHQPLSQPQLDQRCRQSYDSKASEHTYGGCYFLSFATQRCYFFWRAGDQHAFEHSLKHCQGYDHPAPFLLKKYEQSPPSISSAWAVYRIEWQQKTRQFIHTGLSVDDAVRATEKKAILSSLALWKQLSLPLNDEQARKQGFTLLPK
jgi:hypothetical protein